MGGKPGSMPASAGARRWPGVLGGLGSFVLVWLSCWFFREELVAWLMGPTLDALPQDDFGLPFLPMSPSIAFLGYVRVATVPALITALPFLTCALLFRRSVPAAAFLGLCYGATALAFINVRFGLLPPLLHWLVSVVVRSRAEGVGVSLGYVLTTYLRLLTNLFAVQAVGGQLAVVLLFSTRLQRARAETWHRPVRHLIALSVATVLLGALLTPPEPHLHWRFSLPLVALYALATLAGRGFAGQAPAAPASSSA